MPLQYKTCGRVIHAHQQMMSFNDEIIKIRPKTFSLLLMFIKNPYEILSKQVLLETIWDDVEVGEQVLFQTIRELRNIFENEDVIKTHPRKGYAWVTSVEQVVQHSTEQVDEHSAEQNSKATIKKNSFPWQQLTIFIIFCIATAFYSMNKSTTNSSVTDTTNATNSEALILKGSLVILPVKSTIADNDHGWVYLGAMDQLISRLKSDNELVVLSTDYVLTVMEEADLPENYSTKNLRRIFEVSGASLVVETELSGSSHDYQLKYTFHFKDDIKRGVIFESNINNALVQLANKIAAYTNQPINELDLEFTSEFGSEMLVKALDLNEQGDHLAASMLLESLIQLEVNNIVARRILAETYLRLRKLPEAKQHLLNATELAIEKNSLELPKLYHGLAIIASIQKNFDQAIKLLEVADNYAIEKSDWLYRAYIAQLMARINIKKENFELANTYLNNALKYHGVIQCPIGTSIILLQLNDLANLQGNKQQAEQYFTRASQIIHERNLTFMMGRLKKDKREVLK